MESQALSLGGIASMSVIVGLVGLTVPARSATRTCRQNAAALRESLETVVEATIDGQTAQVPAAAERAARWWRSHHQAFRHGPEAAGLMESMAVSARKGDSREAAHSAVLVAVASFKWCAGRLRTDDQLMLLDLVGMTGWLRARGASLDWPSGVKGATDSLATRLAGRGKRTLAKRLRAAVQSTMATTASGDVAQATRLLNLVDEVEMALR